MSVLIDTNILIYAWDANDKDKHNKAINAMEKYGREACLSVQNLSEFSTYMIRHGRDFTWLNETIETYSRLMKVFPINELIVQKAIQAVDQYKMSFWDAQIWAVAFQHDIPIILSEDGPTNQTIAGITYRNPLE